MISETEMAHMVEAMIADLRRKIERDVPDEGNFPMVYSEFKIKDRSLSLTDVLLTLLPMPDSLPDHKTQRWLELWGYKLPVPYKSTSIVFRGSKQEVLEYLNLPEAASKILDLIPRLNYNLMDI